MIPRLLALLLACALAGCASAAAPVTEAKTGSALEVDDRCAVDADCAVKNVGNCCGEYPACVNKNSPTFPEQVKADCAREGRMAICGFPVISGCRCIEQRCEDVTGPAATPEETM